MSEDYLLLTKDITKQYKNVLAVDHINLSLKKGEIYGLIGPNGAGKTTLLKMLAGLAAPTEGDYTVFGKSGKSTASLRDRIGVLIETPGLFSNLSAFQNMKVKALALGFNDDDYIRELIDYVGLSSAGKRPVKKYSLGMKQRLGIALSLVSHPDLLLLDEPINGLDPQGIIEMRELILKLNKEQGITVLISSHILDELAKLATHYGFIDHGKIIRQMSATELENECRKRIRMKVDDTKVLAGIMDAKGVEYKIIDEKNAEVFSTFNFSELAVEFAKENCNIISMEEHDESLEAFFISLIGGEAHA